MSYRYRHRINSRTQNEIGIATTFPNTMFKKIIIFVCSLCLIQPLTARPGAGSSSSSGSRSSSGSSSRTSTPASSGWGKSSSTPAPASPAANSTPSSATPSSSWGQSTSTATPASPRTAADSNLAQKSATTAAPAAKSTPASNPAAQPSQTAAPAGLYDNGTYHSVYTDSSRGGTGFWDQYGHWILINSLLNSGNRNVTYVYPPSDTSSSAYPQRQEQKRGLGFFGILFLLLVLAGIGVGIFFLIKAMTHRPGKSSEQETTNPTPEVKPQMSSQQTDSSLPEFWENIKPGSTALLSDEESLTDNIKNGKGPTPQEYAIKSIQTLTEIRDIGKWIAFHLDGAQGRLLLIAKIVDADMALRVYYPAPEFPAGTRTSLIEKDVKWLFQPPEDETRFAPEDLAITTEFTR